MKNQTGKTFELPAVKYVFLLESQVGEHSFKADTDMLCST